MAIAAFRFRPIALNLLSPSSPSLLTYSQSRSLSDPSSTSHDSPSIHSTRNHLQNTHLRISTTIPLRTSPSHPSSSTSSTSPPHPASAPTPPRNALVSCETAFPGAHQGILVPSFPDFGAGGAARVLRWVHGVVCIVRRVRRRTADGRGGIVAGLVDCRTGWRG